MNIRRSRWQSLGAAAGVACLALTAAACSSSSSSSAPATTLAPAVSASAAALPAASATGSPSGVPAGLTGTAKTIATNWVTFFSPATPVATRVTLLENGPAFASALRSLSTNAQAKLIAAQVTAVRVTSSTAATVTWNLLFSGTAVRSNQKGEAVYQGRVWKVSDTSFCGLLKLVPPVPAACNS
jgi:hypothetical protein